MARRPNLDYRLGRLELATLRSGFSGELKVWRSLAGEDEWTSLQAGKSLCLQDREKARRPDNIILYLQNEECISPFRSFKTIKGRHEILIKSPCWDGFV